MRWREEGRVEARSVSWTAEDKEWSKCGFSCFFLQVESTLCRIVPQAVDGALVGLDETPPREVEVGRTTVLESMTR